MQGTDRFEVTSFLGRGSEKKFFKVQCRESLGFFTMEVVSSESIAEPNSTQFGTVAESLPTWGLPFCMELRYVFETQQKRYYVLDFGGEANLADILNDGLPEPTVLFIAAELGLALECLHEVGVSYNELDLCNVVVDNNGHVVLWREFEGKEYWHVSECICGVHGVNCGKSAHEVKRRGINVLPGQRDWEEISLGMQDDWRRLGALLCQLLIGRVDFQNQSVEEVIISLFITPNTKDFLYGLVTGIVQSFEDVKCHPCFESVDWAEVKSKSFPSPLMANYRSRLSSTTSSRLSKSPSLQNVYTSGMSAQQERGVFVKSALSRTHSSSELRSYSPRPSLSAFERGSHRRNTLSVPYSGATQNQPDREHLRIGENHTTPNQDSRILRAYSQRVGVNPTLSLKRQMFERKFERPPCLSAPSSPRSSLDTPNLVHPPSLSAPSLKGSVDPIDSGNVSSPSPTNTIAVFNEPESNPLHRGNKKLWGNANLHAAYDIFSSNLKRNEDGAMPGKIDASVDTNLNNSPPVYGIYTDNDGHPFPKDNEAIPCQNYGPIDYSQQNTYPHSYGVHGSPVSRQNSNSAIPDKSRIPVNSGQPNTYPTEVSRQGYRTRLYSIDVNSANAGMNSRNPPSSSVTNRSYFQPSCQPKDLSQESMKNVDVVNGIYFTNSQNSPGIVNNMKNIADRTSAYLKISDQQKQFQEHLPQHRINNVDNTDRIQSLRSENPTSNIPWGNSNRSNDTVSPPMQRRNNSLCLDTFDGDFSSFFQTSPSNQNVSTEQSSRETANLLFQEHFRSRRGSSSPETSGKVSPNLRNTENNQSRGYANKFAEAPQEQAPVILQEQTQVRRSANPGRPSFNSKGSPINRGVKNTIPSEDNFLNEYTEAMFRQEQTQGSVDYSGLRAVPDKELRNDFNESGRDTADNFYQGRQENHNINVCSTSLQVTPNRLALPANNTTLRRQNSRSPEPVIAVHPSTSQDPPNNRNPGDIHVRTDDAEILNRFQEKYHRRRSSTDVASLSSLRVSATKTETPRRKTSLSRSVSCSQFGDGVNSSRNDLADSGGQVNCRRSMALRRIPSFEEFRTMRALNKMAYGEANPNVDKQNDENNNCKETNDYISDGNSNIGINKNSNSNNSRVAEATTTSSTSNPVIQDLLVKYGLDKAPSSFKVHRDSSKRADIRPIRDSNSPTPSAQNDNLGSSSPTDTKQRLLNILDDFLAARTKHRTLSSSASVNNINAFDSRGDRRRLSLSGTSIEKHQSDSPKDCFMVGKMNLENSENYECGGSKELCSPRNELNKTEKSPSFVISSPNSDDICERRRNKETSMGVQSKTQNSSKTVEKNSVSPRRRSKKTNTAKKPASVVEHSENRATTACEQSSKNTCKDPDILQSVDNMTSEVKPKEREVSRRVSEKARNMARRHRESLEIVKKSGKKARKDRRESFTQALQNKDKENDVEQVKYNNQENDTNDTAAMLSGPVKGDHSVDIESPRIQQKEMKYLRLMNRRTSSLLSLTDDFGGDLDEFEPEDEFENRTESLSELNKDTENFYSHRDQMVGRDNSFLSVKNDTNFPRGRRACRTESSSSLLSRGSSFHSNYSADSGSLHLDFEDSDDDDLFYPDEPRETHEKPESEIQRNDSGLGDEIGVGTRVKKRWENLARAGSRQSMIVASWRELTTKKDGTFEECQEKAEVEKRQEGEQQQGRKISRNRRISRERQPNAIDCPDCGRAFLVEEDKPSVKSQGPNQTLICYKCQSHRVERKEAITELVQTEINYGNDFQIIKEEFLSPMQTGGIISSDNLAKIFLNIQELLDVSTKFCKKIENSMEECINNNDEELCHMNVGKIFVENVELLQAYELYCSKQPEAINLLESLQKKNDVLRVFLNITCRENPRCRKMDINSFLLAPVQRVTKYPLLLSRIRRATPRWHGDREDLKLAQRKVEEQIAKINSLTKSSEMKAKKFQSNLGKSDSVDSSRLKKLASDVLAWTLDEMQLLMHGQLKVLCTEFGGGQSWTKRAMKRSIETHMLFCIRGQNEPINVDSEDDDCVQFPNVSEISDASLLLLKRKSNGKYTLFRDEIKLRDCVVYEEAEPDSFGLVHMGKESFLFTARTTKDARKWIKYLKLQTKNQGKWRRRRNASANIMLNTS